MDLGRPSTTTKARSLIVMVQYYMDMWTIKSNVLSPLTEAASRPRGGKILWNDALYRYFTELERMVSTETLLSYPYWKLPFAVHTDASDKHLGAVISQNNKPIDLLSRKLSKSQRNYTTTEKKHLAIVECLKQFRGIFWLWNKCILRS